MSQKLEEMHQEMKELCGEHYELIAVGPGALKEAQERASKFLVVVAVLAEYKLDLEKRKSKITTLRDAFFAHAFQAHSGAQTEKKLVAEANKDYTAHREKVEDLEAEIYWARSNMEIFNNAHVLYRQMGRTE